MCYPKFEITRAHTYLILVMFIIFISFVVVHKEFTLHVFNRFHVFWAFKSATATNTNMAEVGHSRNATRGAKNDTLARVAEDHIVESALLKAKLDSYIGIVVKLIDLIHSLWVICLFGNDYQFYISLPFVSHTFTENYNKLLVITPPPPYPWL